MHKKVGKTAERKLKLCVNDEATADAIVHYCLVVNGLMRHVFQKIPPLSPFEWKGFNHLLQSKA